MFLLWDMIYGGRKLNRVKKRAHIVIALCLVLVLCACGASKLEKQLDLGAKYLEELDYDNAIAAYTAAIDVDPASIDAYVGLAKAYVGKASTIEEYTESLDTILLAYTTINDLQNDTETEYTGVDETMDSVAEYKADVEAAFIDSYTAAYRSLSADNDVEGIEKLSNDYGQYIEDFIDLSAPKLLDEVEIDDETAQLFSDFLDGKEECYLEDSGVDVEISAGAYTLSDLDTIYTNFGGRDSYSGYDGYEVSYIDCGKDGNIEMLITFTYEAYSEPFYDTFIIANQNGKLKSVYNQNYGYRSNFAFYYNGLICSYGSGGAAYTSATFLYLNADYEMDYYFECGSSDYSDDISNDIMDYDGSCKFDYIAVGDLSYEGVNDTRYIPTIVEGNTDVSGGLLDFYSPIESKYIGINSNSIYDDNSAYSDDFDNAYEYLNSHNHKSGSISDVPEMLKEQREKIGLTNYIYFSN